MDVLSDVLRCLQLRSSVYFQAEFHAPWGMAIDQRTVAAFHFVVRGSCWLRHGGEEALRLGEGDLVVFPRGHRHSLSDRPNGDVTPAEEFLGAGSPYGGPGPTSCSMVCGHFEYDMGARHPLLMGLPSLLHSQAGSSESVDWYQTAIRIAVLESQRADEMSGSTAIVERLAETLLIQVIRDYALRTGEGYLAALSDPGLGRALNAIHDEPSRAWTVESLGRVASMSRSAFANHFREAVGLTPMQYATQWRMHTARRLLQTRETSVAAVAELVGYSDGFAFAKAFKRMFDESPSNLRRRVTSRG